MTELKDALHHYLRSARAAVLWKLEGVDEHDVRRPMTPTGTNLLGVVKHLAVVEVGYFRWSFGRAFDQPLPWWDDDAEPNADMWATAEESREDLVALYRRAQASSDETIAELPLDAPADVPWWPGGGGTTLGTLLVHVVAETNRHAGHLDVVRELVDGAAGLREGVSNLPDDLDWAGVPRPAAGDRRPLPAPRPRVGPMSEPNPPARRRVHVRRALLPAVVVLVALFVVAPIAGSLSGKLGGVTENEQAAFLPDSAESTRSLDLETRFAGDAGHPRAGRVGARGRPVAAATCRTWPPPRSA